MDERILINKEKIFKDDLSKRYPFLIMETFFMLLYFALHAFVALLLSEVFHLNLLIAKRVVWSIYLVYAILKIYCCVRIIYIFKTKKFTIETDVVISVENGKIDMSLIEGFLINPRRNYGYSGMPDRVTFENFGSIIVYKQETGCCSAGDRYYLVKIKIFGKNRIVSFYNEKAYYMV